MLKDLHVSTRLELETPYIADTQVFEDPTNAPSCVQIVEGLLQLVVREYVPVPLLEVGSALVQTSRRVSFGSNSDFDSLPHPRVVSVLISIVEGQQLTVGTTSKASARPELSARKAKSLVYR
ncbi:hypothetical protein HBI81_033740 [Parastagonospora nodorum]|nr:hypothetical protein HBI81_033740 [Parastagonospora nodorum]